MRLVVFSNFENRIQFSEYLFGFHSSNVWFRIHSKNSKDFPIDLVDNIISAKFRNFFFGSKTKFLETYIFSYSYETNKFCRFNFDVKFSKT